MQCVTTLLPIPLKIMSDRPSIASAQQEQTAPVKPPVDTTRNHRVHISGYFRPEVRKSLRLVQAHTDRQIQQLLGEALNLLFAKYKVPEAVSDQDMGLE